MPCLRRLTGTHPLDGVCWHSVKLSAQQSARMNVQKDTVTDAIRTRKHAGCDQAARVHDALAGRVVSERIATARVEASVAAQIAKCQLRASLRQRWHEPSELRVTSRFDVAAVILVEICQLVVHEHGRRNFRVDRERDCFADRLSVLLDDSRLRACVLVGRQLELKHLHSWCPTVTRTASIGETH